MFPLSKEFVLKRIAAALKKEHAKIEKNLETYRRELKKNPDSYWTEKNIAYYERKLKGFKALPGMPWRPRKGRFEGPISYGGNWYSSKHDGEVSCSFSIETGTAYSYGWYELGKVINGVYVVNSYYYSQTTTRHLYDLKRTLEILGVKYTELQAPRGLQNLESSQGLYLEGIGKATMCLEFGRGDTKMYAKQCIKNAMQELAKLEKISGIKTSKKMIEDAIAMARKARAERLEGEKRDREKTFKIQYAYALKNQDLKKIVELTAKDQRRVKRGNSSLIEQFKKEKQK